MDTKRTCGSMLITLWLLSTRAIADGVPVTVTNDGTEDIVVTIYDTTVGPKALVLSQRINGFTTIPVNLSQDSTGRANMAWTAVTVDPSHRRCGHADRPGLADSSSVTVHADAECGEDAAANAASQPAPVASLED